MTEKANELLQKMASEVDNGKRSSFDSFFYLGYQKSIIEELEDNGYINVKNDVIASIELTRSGYEETKR